MERKLLFVMVVGVLCSTALAGGPLGPPMSVLDSGQWAIDLGYFYEEIDLHGDGEWKGYGRKMNGGWGDWELVDIDDDECLTLVDLGTNTWMASIEYGIWDNWDLYLRLGVADAEADAVWSWPGGSYERSVDFGYGFAWQCGTAFTIHQSGPWTFGGRVQVGFAYPDEWTDSGPWTDEEDPNETSEWEESVDLDWWQAMGYVGAVYQMSDALQLYAGVGWQTMHATADYKLLETYYYSGMESYQWRETGDYKLEHDSAIGVFGALWSPTDKTNVSVDVLFGEDNKFGIGVLGLFKL